MVLPLHALLLQHLDKVFPASDERDGRRLLALILRPLMRRGGVGVGDPLFVIGVVVRAERERGAVARRDSKGVLASFGRMQVTA